MRRRNKKMKLEVSMVPISLVMAVALVVAVAIGYVWIGARCDSLCREIKVLEAQKSATEKRYLNEEYKWMRLKSPSNIEAALEKFGIAMTWPRRDQVVRRGNVDMLSARFDVSDNYALRVKRDGERNLLHE